MRSSSFEQFYSFHGEEFKKRVNVISIKEFIEREGQQNGLVTLNDKDYKRVFELASHCENRRKSACLPYYYVLVTHTT